MSAPLWTWIPARVKPSDECNPGCQPDCDLRKPLVRARQLSCSWLPDLQKRREIIHASCCLKLLGFRQRYAATKKNNNRGEEESFREGQENVLSGCLSLFQLWVRKSEDTVPGSLLVRDLGCLVSPEAWPPEKWSFLSRSVPHVQDICRFPRLGPCSDDQRAPHLHTHTLRQRCCLSCGIPWPLS